MSAAVRLFALVPQLPAPKSFAACVRGLSLSSLLALLSAAVLWTEVRNEPAWISLMVGIGAIGCLGIALCAGTGRFILLGILICVLPGLSPNALGFTLAVWLVADRLRGDGVRIGTTVGKLLEVAGSLFVLGYLGQAVVSLSRELDFALISSIHRAGGIRAVVAYAASTFQHWNDSSVFMATTVVGALLATAAQRWFSNPVAVARFVLGLSLGAAAAACWFGLQVVEFSPWLSMNRGGFWRLIGRYPASFSDPNAFGIMGFLLVVLLSAATLQYRRVLPGIAAVAVLCSLPWSGSRTAFLGFAVVLALCAWSRKLLSERQRRHVRIGFALLAVLGLALIVPPLNQAVTALPLPPAFARTAEVLRWDQWQLGHSSRVIFGRMALYVFTQAPLLGVGLSGFISAQVEAGQALGFALGEWRDNANNLYLQVLAEGGIVGFALLIAAFALYLRAVRIGSAELESAESLPPRSYFKFASRSLLGVMLLLFFIGPHLYFEEVRFLLAVLIGIASAEVTPTANSTAPYSRRAVSLGVLLACAYLVACARTADARNVHGFYGPEFSEGQELRWSSGQAEFSFCELDRNSSPELLVNAPRPGLADRPVVVELELLDASPDSAVTRTMLTSPGWQTIVLPRSLSGGGADVRYQLRVSPLWSPTERGGNDPRWLGVQVRWHEGFCG